MEGNESHAKKKAQPLGSRGSTARNKKEFATGEQQKRKTIAPATKQKTVFEVCRFQTFRGAPTLEQERNVHSEIETTRREGNPAPEKTQPLGSGESTVYDIEDLKGDKPSREARGKKHFSFIGRAPVVEREHPGPGNSPTKKTQGKVAPQSKAESAVDCRYQM